MSFQANCLPTGIGSLPHTDVQEACRFIFQNLPQIPFWPQLPQLSFHENMYAQYCEGLPGLKIDENKERFYLDHTQALHDLESFYERFLSEDLSAFAITPDYSASWRIFMGLAAQSPSVEALKGHVTGPISYGLQVTDENRKSVIYDDNLRDVIIKQITRKAQWQERELKKICPNTIIFVDEPYLSSFGSAFVNLQREEVTAALNEVFSAINGISAVHCCGNTDWSLLLQTDVNMLNLDAYEFVDALLLYKEDLIKFLERGGIIAWGIVPTEAEIIESLNQLEDKFAANISKVAKETGTPLDKLLRQSLITPACGVGSGTMDNAVTVFNTTARLSEQIRKAYGLADQR